MKTTIALTFLLLSALAHAGKVSDFVRPLAGTYQMNGAGCGAVEIDLKEINGYEKVTVDGTLFLVSTTENFKVKGRELSFTTEETDNAWPNLKDWKKQEVKIMKDEAGRLESVTVKSGRGKPFYRNNRWQTKCTLK